MNWTSTFQFSPHSTVSEIEPSNLQSWQIIDMYNYVSFLVPTTLFSYSKKNIDQLNPHTICISKTRVLFLNLTFIYKSWIGIFHRQFYYNTPTLQSISLIPFRFPSWNSVWLDILTRHLFLWFLFLLAIFHLMVTSVPFFSKSFIFDMRFMELCLSFPVIGSMN